MAPVRKAHHLPYISYVVAARNDDHGGSLSKRMQLFINGILDQCRRNELDAELIIVEWNPPPNRPRIAEAFSWPTEPSPCVVRIIEVPATIHNSFDNAEKIPLFQFIGKNVGIRRSTGQFVLATNVDLLYSEEMVSYLATRRLAFDCYYRANRYDVPSSVPEDVDLASQLSYCRNNILRIFHRDGTYSHVTGTFYRIYPPSFSVFRKASLVFERTLTELRGVARQAIHNINLRRDLSRSAPYRTRLTSRRRASQLRRILQYIRAPLRASLHTNAAGDFTLMAREHWESLRGYPELPWHGLHLDSVLCYMSRFLPLQEIVLPEPMRTYHIEHEHGYTPEAALWNSFENLLDERGIPHMSRQEFNDLAIQMERRGAARIYNDDNWGLGSKELREVRIGGPD